MSGQEEIFDAAIRILLFDDRCVTFSAAPDGLSIRFPTTRKLADFLQIPHYYVLPVFAMMEKDGLIRRVERVGISTTPEGTIKVLRLMARDYREAAEGVLGAELLQELLKKAGAGHEMPGY
jgi:hypothetical protein